MIQIKLVRTLGIILFIISLYYAYQYLVIITNYHETEGHIPLSFGYPITYEWSWLILIFWATMLIGSVGIVLNRSVGWVLINPLIILSVVYLAVYLFQPSVENRPFTILQLALGLIFGISLNLKSTLKLFRINGKSIYLFYSIALSVAAVFSYFFLTISQRG